MERVRTGGGGGRPAEVCFFFSFLLFLSSSSLVFVLLPGGSDDAAVAPLAAGAAGLGEGLLVCVLLGMHLVVQEVAGELVAVLDLQLGNRTKSHDFLSANAATYPSSSHPFKHPTINFIYRLSKMTNSLHSNIIVFMIDKKIEMKIIKLRLSQIKPRLQITFRYFEPNNFIFVVFIVLTLL